MPIHLISRDSKPPDEPRFDIADASPSGQRTFLVTDCTEIGMGGPIHGSGRITEPGETDWSLGTITEPNGLYYPWASQSDLALWFAEGIMIGNPTDRTACRYNTAMSWVDFLVGSAHTNRFILARSNRFELCDPAMGRPIVAVDGIEGLKWAGFNARGDRAAFFVQKALRGSVWIYVFDSTTGKQTESINAADIDPLITSALTVSAPKLPVITANGLDHGKPDMCYGRALLGTNADPAEGTFWLGFDMPTGELRVRDGEQHAVVKDHWLHFDIEA